MTNVLFETALGSFTVEVDTENAPLTATNFLAYVDGGHYDRATAYRIVTLANQPPERDPKIEVVQLGIDPHDDQPEIFPPIAHETTEVTGLRHDDMTVSMARLTPGSATSEIFICIGPQPELDFGGRRNPDGQGFAAFGRVVDGRDTVLAIFGTAQTDSEYPTNPVAFSKAHRVA
jgi:peptidyl-prolyl cis-trans isomerase A (cyclophilin A)